MKKNIPILLIMNMTMFIISLAISFVILFRPFYYFHINSLDLPDKTGFTHDEIKEAYDDIMDYLVFHKEFSTGILKYSDDGKNHFKDCRILFSINFAILAVTSFIIILKKKIFHELKIFKYNIYIWSGMLNIVLFALITIISLCLDFDKIFTIFHNIFFIGKNNWLFDSSKDEIINILPHRFFINCGILIVSIIIIISILLLIREMYIKKNCKKKNNVI